MGDKLEEVKGNPWTPEEKLQRDYQQKLREEKRGRARASVVRSQILDAYKILESIRFDFVSDTMFRDYITKAERSLEDAINDFLMSDKYWEETVEKFRDMGVEGYKEWLKQGTVKSIKT